MFEVSIEDTLGKGKITFELVSHELSNDVTIVIPIDKINKEFLNNGGDIKWFVPRDALIKGITALK